MIRWLSDCSFSLLCLIILLSKKKKIKAWCVLLFESSCKFDLYDYILLTFDNSIKLIFKSGCRYAVRHSHVDSPAQGWLEVWFECATHVPCRWHCEGCCSTAQCSPPHTALCPLLKQIRINKRQKQQSLQTLIEKNNILLNKLPTYWNLFS